MFIRINKLFAFRSVLRVILDVLKEVINYKKIENWENS